MEETQFYHATKLHNNTPFFITNVNRFETADKILKANTTCISITFWHRSLYSITM